MYGHREITGGFYRIDWLFCQARCPERGLLFLLFEARRFFKDSYFYDFSELFTVGGLDIFEQYIEWTEIEG